MPTTSDCVRMINKQAQVKWGGSPLLQKPRTHPGHMCDGPGPAGTAVTVSNVYPVEMHHRDRADARRDVARRVAR